jgi:hypothetical protein
MNERTAVEAKQESKPVTEKKQYFLASSAPPGRLSPTTLTAAISSVGGEWG